MNIKNLTAFNLASIFHLLRLTQRKNLMNFFGSDKVCIKYRGNETRQKRHLCRDRDLADVGENSIELFHGSHVNQVTP